MEKRQKEILGALVEQLRSLLTNAVVHAHASLPGELRRETVEYTTYSWIMRLLVLRAMEVRGLHSANQVFAELPEQLSPFRETTVALSPSADDWWTTLQQTCAALAQVLPGIFTLNDSPTIPRPDIATLFACCQLVSGKQPALPGVTPSEINAALADPDAPGWAYQFYQTEARAEINAKCKNGGKVASQAELAAKTQLFTEPYMVQWLLQNSLGRSYAEAYPHSTLPGNWTCFIQPDDSDRQPRAFCLEELTFLDPCMGSGHFLRAAFDLFVDMYREQYPKMSADDIAERILARHLFGIDLDPRAAQICALTLYLRAWELVRNEGVDHAGECYAPPVMHLAATPANLAPGALQRHLQRYPQDLCYTSDLEKLFAGLEQVGTLGSLLRVREYLDLACSATLFEHVVTSCLTEEPHPTDAGLALFGENGHRVHLLSLLDRRYALIATNPPYLDSRDMHETLRDYIATGYQAGKRDLYAAFLLRCLELCHPQGRIAMVTMQSWMFNRSFAELRTGLPKKSTEEQEKAPFTGLLRETCLETLVHLGAHAFEEIAGEIVQCVLVTFARRSPAEAFRPHAWRLVGMRNVEEKRAALLHMATSRAHPPANRPRQQAFLSLPESPLVYYLSDNLMRLFAQSEKLQDIAYVRQGLATADNARFTRCYWEVPAQGSLDQHGYPTGRWFRYAKGGSYQKWAGLMWLVVDWEYTGLRIKAGVDALGRPRFRDNAPQFAFRAGLTYTFIASGSFGTRTLDRALFDVAGTSLFPKNSNIPLAGLAAITSSHVVSYLLRVLTQDLKFNAGYVANTPLASHIPWEILRAIGTACIALKELLVAQDPVEDAFVQAPTGTSYSFQAVLHTLEGWNEHLVCAAYQLDQQDQQAVIDETGIPAGWYPLLAGYDMLPALEDELEDAPELPQGLAAYLVAHPRIVPGKEEFAHIKADLRTLYAAGPRVKEVELTGPAAKATEGEKIDTHVPIPAETFLEGLSLKMHLHPLSVYWLLEEMQTSEDLHCRSEERRLLEDRLSVLVLRLLGHRWPRQIEAFEPPPEWAEPTGIIPLVCCPGQRALAERVRERLVAEEGDSGAQALEQRLRALTGQNLEQWLLNSFFERHISQFKQRPVVWHLTSSPARNLSSGRKKSGENNRSPLPAFACLLYYHACTKDTLSRLYTHYVEPSVRNIQSARTSTLATDAAPEPEQARIDELQTFAARLRQVEAQGFACRALQDSAAIEVLDRWSGDGQAAPADRAAFQRAEAAWHIDRNDGVRVNIAPLQLAGVLARDVLSPQDALKALDDRANWRAAERRLVREGKLPRCGWLENSVSTPAPADNWADQSKRASVADQRASRATVPQRESARSAITSIASPPENDHPV